MLERRPDAHPQPGEVRAARRARRPIGGDPTAQGAGTVRAPQRARARPRRGVPTTACSAQPRHAARSTQRAAPRSSTCKALVRQRDGESIDRRSCRSSASTRARPSTAPLPMHPTSARATTLDDALDDFDDRRVRRRCQLGRVAVGRQPVGRIAVGRIAVGRVAVGRQPVGRIPVGLVAVVGEPVGLIGHIGEARTVIGGIRTYVAARRALAARRDDRHGSWLLGAPGRRATCRRSPGSRCAFALVQLLPVPFPRGAQLELVRVEEAVVVPLVLLLEPAPALVAVAIGILARPALLGSTRPDADQGRVQRRRSSCCRSAPRSLLTWAVAGETRSRLSARSRCSRPRPGWSRCSWSTSCSSRACCASRPARTMRQRPARRRHAQGSACGSPTRASARCSCSPPRRRRRCCCVALVPLAMLHGAWRVHAEHAADEQRLRELGTAVGGCRRGCSLEPRGTRSCARARARWSSASGAEVRLFEDGRTFWVRRTRRPASSAATTALGGGEPLGRRQPRLVHRAARPAARACSASCACGTQRDPETAPRTFSRRDRTLLEMLGPPGRSGARQLAARRRDRRCSSARSRRSSSTRARACSCSTGAVACAAGTRRCSRSRASRTAPSTHPRSRCSRRSSRRSSTRPSRERSTR